ncbi:eukaryotic peptide chain release factor subunit 1 [Naegleria gruberi]|uniref:Eukaryotic peptide chain release factor subunit 1 n=1 Tax=Naegleria gruberi TaxID=5762 RepID=D2V1R5_NAEGR|nr:eukaryotic peptide chain release factor subunit 1 [Naegleria gruberi]EFC49356.1 eukaryotic peptide chain release factor subunit 1 [Naegleria gruberi]|eukprot:XP_002682100.1 eukaryotic peptide chain release factor subunit 1 [Naegleria gruberi strain NEG-M]
MSESAHEDRTIEQWRIKKLIKNLSEARGNGTSMISLIIPPKDQIARVTKMLQEEYGTASNIKSRVNRISVQDAITSTIQRLKLITRVPENGLVVYSGTVLTEDGKEKRVTYDMEPFKPINTSLYLCDNKFHVEPLQELLESDEKFGFIIMDGNGCLYGTLSGNTSVVLQKITVDLPKKHGRGGQSALRFARLRLEKRHNYVRRCAELSVQHFITNDRPNVSGLILAGSADFKSDLTKTDLLDQRLQAIILKVVDIAYGGEIGFQQAIELSQDCLKEVNFIREKKIIDEFFTEISKDTNKFVFGVRETISAMDMGAIKTLIVWENLPHLRVSVKQTNGEFVVKYLMPEDLKTGKHTCDENGLPLEFEQITLLEWLVENYKAKGCTLEIITNSTPEGSQFCRGFGGMGGILTYPMNMDEVAYYENDEHLAEDQFNEDDFI